MSQVISQAVPTLVVVCGACGQVLEAQGGDAANIEMRLEGQVWQAVPRPGARSVKPIFVLSQTPRQIGQAQIYLHLCCAPTGSSTRQECP